MVQFMEVLLANSTYILGVERKRYKFKYSLNIKTNLVITIITHITYFLGSLYRISLETKK